MGFTDGHAQHQVVRSRPREFHAVPRPLDEVQVGWHPVVDCDRRNWWGFAAGSQDAAIMFLEVIRRFDREKMRRNYARMPVGGIYSPCEIVRRGAGVRICSNEIVKDIEERDMLRLIDRND